MKNSILLFSFVLCSLLFILCHAQTQFQRSSGGTSFDYAFSIIQTTDGGYAVAGHTSSFGAGYFDLCILKVDASGTLQWSRIMGGPGFEYGFSIIQTTDGGYAVAGSTTSFGAGHLDFYIVKLNASGTLQWSKTIGGTGADHVYSIIKTTDGGYIVGGYTTSFGAGSYDMYIVKLDASGTLLWNRTVGGTGDDESRSIIQTTDGGYAVAGGTLSFGAGSGDIYVVKLNASGTLQWSKTIGGTNSDFAPSITQTADGGYAMAGWSRSFAAGQYDMYIVKLDASANTCGQTTSPASISGSGGILGSPNSSVTTPNPSVTSPSATTGTGLTLTTVCVIGIQPISNEIPASFQLYQNFPNPFNPVTKIGFDIPSGGIIHELSLRIYDNLGREITTLVNEQLNPGSYEIEWDAWNFPSGVYYYTLQSGDFSESKKMLLIK